MALLDRFRTQPPHTHPDPAVRLQFVTELPLEDPATIASFARDDSDPQVRRTAVAKLLDPGLLGPLSRDDRDGSVRTQALEMLRALALEAFEGSTESQALAAVDEVAASHDARTLGEIAKRATRAAVAERAVKQMADPRALGSVARHAVSDLARRHAFEWLRDRGETAELLGVALNAEHKDVAVAAVDLLPNRHDLQQIAVSSRNKSAARRAANRLREMDERLALEAAQAAAAARLAAEPLRSSVSVNMSDATSSSVPPVVRARDASEADEPDAERRRLEQAAAAERARVAAQQLTQAGERDDALGRLADEGAAAAQREPLAEATKAFDAIRRRWTALAAGYAIERTTSTRFADAEASLQARGQQAREAEARATRDAWQRLQNLLARVEPLPSKTDLSLKAAERALRDVRAAMADPPAGSTQVDAAALLGRLSAAHEALIPKVNELREADEWQKWANVTIQEALCAQMEALLSLDDPEEVVRRSRDLQQQWRLAADVPRDKADGLWRRFKSAHDVAWARCEAHFAAQAQVRAVNLAKKIDLCEQAESLSESTQWIQTAEALKTLQADWKAVGPVSRGHEREVWDRFRTACDRFFSRRHDDLAARKTAWSQNLARKDALCARVEALAESTDWEPAAAEIKRLQAEWRTVGPVKKSRSEAIWQRFRTACDHFFLRYAHRHDTARAERVAAREALCAALESLAPGDASATEGAATSPAPSDAVAPLAPEDLLARVRALRTDWRQEQTQRGVDIDRARALDARFGAALLRAIASAPAAFANTELDPDANRRRMETLVIKIEDLAKALAGPAAAADATLSPSNRLASMLKEALAANTIGGRADDGARFRAAAADLAQAQTAWAQIGDVPDEVRRPLAARFERAARQISERVGPSLRSEGGGRSPRGAGGPGGTSRPRDAGRPPARYDGRGR